VRCSIAPRCGKCGAVAPHDHTRDDAKSRHALAADQQIARAREGGHLSYLLQWLAGAGMMLARTSRGARVP
jgi:hypothetical protein